MNRCKKPTRACLLGFCGLLIASPLYAQAPEHKQKPAAHSDSSLQQRRAMRDEINSGLVGVVSEGTDETIDLAISVAAPGRLRILPIAGVGALQNARDVMFARGVDFGIIQTDVLDSLRRDPLFPGVEKYLHYITKLYD